MTLVDFSERELEWLNEYARTHDLSVAASVRLAVRILNLVEESPGAWEKVLRLSDKQLGKKLAT